MRVLLLLFVLPLLLLGCALLLIALPLPAPFPPAWSSGRNLLAAVTTGFVGFAALVAIAVYAVRLFLRAGGALDGTFLAAGLRSERHAGFGRRYAGTVDGRAVEATTSPPYRFEPARLEVYVKAAVGTRVAIGRSRPLLDCADCAPLPADAYDLGDVVVCGPDGDAAQRLLANAGVRDAVARLLGIAVVREIYLQPDRVWVRARPRTLRDEDARAILTQTLALAAAAGDA